MANGVGDCANSRYKPYICAGNSAQTCLLCGRVKGGDKGCWARGCLRNGGAPETLSERELHNRTSNIRARHRERAQTEQAQAEERLNQERRAQAAAAEARGLKNCLRLPGAPGPKQAQQVSWRLSGPAPYKRPLTKKRLPTSVRGPLFWEQPGKTANCDCCGVLCALYEDGHLEAMPGSSLFARCEVLCQKCAQDTRSF